MKDVIELAADIIEPYVGSTFKLRERALGTAENLSRSNLLAGQQSRIPLPSQGAAANLLHCTFSWTAAERIAAELRADGFSWPAAERIAAELRAAGLIAEDDNHRFAPSEAEIEARAAEVEAYNLAEAERARAARRGRGPAGARGHGPGARGGDRVMNDTDLNLHAIRTRANRALTFAAEQVGGSEYLPDSVREHFDDDVPALIDAVERLTTDLENALDAHGRTVDNVMAEGWNRVADRMERGAYIPPQPAQEGIDSRAHS